MSELYHYGVLGMKWGVRRYQNEDGSLTDAGRARYNKVANSTRLQNKEAKRAKKLLSEEYRNHQLAIRELAKHEQKYYKSIGKKNDFYFQLEDRSYETLFPELEKAGKYHISKSNAVDKYIRDIDSGVLKAGRDFIIGEDGASIIQFKVVNTTTLDGKNKGE